MVYLSKTLNQLNKYVHKLKEVLVVVLNQSKSLYQSQKDNIF